MSTQPEAKQVPLVERLESVPADARLAVDDGPHSTSYYPIGKMAHEAAAELRRLHSVNTEMLGALKELVEIVDGAISDRSTGNMDSFTLQPARIAIAKAEGVKP
jgi:hypothetical protein